MQPCGISNDLFSAYVSLSDWIKALWLIAPLSFVLAFAWIVVNRPRG